MTFDTTIFFYALLFAATLFLVEGVYFLIVDLTGGRERSINRRLKVIGRDGNVKSALSLLRREGSKGKLLTRMFPRLDRLITQAGSTMSVGRLVGIMIAVGVAVFLILGVVSTLPVAAVLFVAFLAGGALPPLVLTIKRRKRRRRFGEQLPEVLDLVVRSLLAGHPMAAALGLVGKEISDPAGTEFGILVDEMTYGLGMDVALANMSERMPHQDFELLVVTVQIQHQSGGNIAEVLSNLSSVIRDRMQMFKKVRAVSAEGRLSAVVIGLLPFVVSGSISVLNPSFFGQVAGDPLFLPLIASAAVMLAMGEFWIWRMVNFRI